MTEIRSVDSSGEVTFGWIRLDWRGGESGWVIHISASDGQEVEYRTDQDCTSLSKVIHPDGMSERYGSGDQRIGEHWHRTFTCTYPRQRGMLVAFLAEKAAILAKSVGPSFPVSAQTRPTRGAPDLTHRRSTSVGPNRSSFSIVRTHRLDYKKSRTEVRDAFNNKTTYAFDLSGQLQEIAWGQTSSSGESTLLVRRASWADGDLQSESFEDSAGNKLMERCFTYDNAGNVIEEILGGELGTSAPSALYRRCIDYGPMNLPVEESDDYVRVTYQYKPGTDLLTERLTYSLVPKKQLIKREKYLYDEWAQLIEEIKEDEVSCLIKRIRRVRSGVAKGLPEVIEEFYRSGDEERLLKRLENEYNAQNLILHQRVFDANDTACYELKWQYDRAGRVIAEWDALGHVRRFAYDENGNCVLEEGPKPEYQILYTHDRANRVVSKEISDEGESFRWRYLYDAMGQLVSEWDLCGNETTHTYDALGQRLSTCYPDGSEMQWTYDPLGHVTEEMNEVGERTRCRHTLRGHLLEAEYPDGTGKQLTYLVSGHLIQKEAVGGAITTYERDGLGRELARRVTGPEGELSASTCRYEGEHLIEKVDGEGVATHYSYDGAGRLILKSWGERQITYTYDALGRLWKETEHCGADAVVSVTERDFLDRVIEERVEDLSGRTYKRVCYGYDELGRQRLERTFDASGASCDRITEYNALGEPVKIIDPIGHATTIKYQREDTLERVETDPSGLSIATRYDCRGRVGQVVKRRANRVLHREERGYDAAGRQIVEWHAVFSVHGERPFELRWEHRFGGRVKRLIEAPGTQLERETSYVYDEAGRLSQTRKPSGVVLERRYDALGRLTRYLGPDSEYTYAYDRSDHLISVVDGEGGRCERTYDASGNLLSELLSNGLKIRFRYDGVGRRTEVEGPGGSSFTYTYEGPFLSAVGCQLSRYAFVHRYLDRDLRGSILSERDIFGKRSRGGDAVIEGFASAA